MTKFILDFAYLRYGKRSHRARCVSRGVLTDPTSIDRAREERKREHHHRRAQSFFARMNEPLPGAIDHPESTQPDRAREQRFWKKTVVLFSSIFFFLFPKLRNFYIFETDESSLFFSPVYSPSPSPRLSRLTSTRNSPTRVGANSSRSATKRTPSVKSSKMGHVGRPLSAGFQYLVHPDDCTAVADKFPGGLPGAGRLRPSERDHRNHLRAKRTELAYPGHSHTPSGTPRVADSTRCPWPTTYQGIEALQIVHVRVVGLHHASLGQIDRQLDRHTGLTPTS